MTIVSGISQIREKFVVSAQVILAGIVILPAPIAEVIKRLKGGEERVLIIPRELFKGIGDKLK